MIHVELRAPGKHGARIRLRVFGGHRVTTVQLRGLHKYSLKPGLYRASAVAVDVRGKRSRLIKLPLRVRR